MFIDKSVMLKCLEKQRYYKKMRKINVKFIKFDFFYI